LVAPGVTVRTVVISPHLDDAVLSIGGSIAAWVAAGRRVTIATLCTHGAASADPQPSLRAFADFDARRDEDRAACVMLGAEPRWLGLVELAFRRPGAPVFQTPVARAGFDTLEAAKRVIGAVCDELAPDHIAVPLGIGNHVDHAEAAVAAADWARDAGMLDRLVFYEDFYALDDRLRRRHPVTRTRPRADVLAGSPRLARVLGKVTASALGHPATAMFTGDATWTASVSPVGGFERVHRAAIAHYRSQLRVFGGLLGVVRAIAADRAAWGGELLWRMV
jgi:LmbE family N-acetylglucosaminyl deacetylase